MVSFRLARRSLPWQPQPRRSTPARPSRRTRRSAGVLSFGAGAGGTATGFAGAPAGSVLAGSSQVRAASASTLPVPTMLDGARAPLCAVAVIRCTTSRGGQARVLAADQRRDAGHVAGRVAGAAERAQLLMLIGQSVGQAAAVAIAHRHNVFARGRDAHPRPGHGEFRRLPVRRQGSRRQHVRLPPRRRWRPT